MVGVIDGYVILVVHFFSCHDRPSSSDWTLQDMFALPPTLTNFMQSHHESDMLDHKKTTVFSELISQFCAACKFSYPALKVNLHGASLHDNFTLYNLMTKDDFSVAVCQYPGYTGKY